MLKVYFQYVNSKYQKLSLRYTTKLNVYLLEYVTYVN
jgi:hypothetical protein